MLTNKLTMTVKDQASVMQNIMKVGQFRRVTRTHKNHAWRKKVMRRLKIYGYHDLKTIKQDKLKSLTLGTWIYLIYKGEGAVICGVDRTLK